MNKKAVGSILLIAGISLVALGVTQRPKAEVLTPQSEETVSSSYDKGQAFVSYVQSKFAETYFSVAPSNNVSDLNMTFKLKDEVYSFALECLWRKGYYKDGIEWATEQKLESLKKISNAQLPVFVLIGVGGTPDSPDEVCIVPLSEVGNILLYKTDLQKFARKNPQSNFFYDSKTQTLK